MVTTRRRQQQEEGKRKREETLNTICNSIRKRGKTLSSTLTNDIVLEILSKVRDVEDLIRFKFACKSWYTLLCEPFFINMHLNQSISNNNFAFMVYYYYFNTHIYSIDCDISSSSFKLNRAVKINTPFKTPFRIYCSCNGIFLVCVSYKLRRICMWNPSTGEHKDLSDELPKISKLPSPWYSLGYDLSRDDYKVIIKYYNKDTRSDAYVYSMRTNSCKRLQDVPYIIYGVVYPPCISFDSGIFLNGAIHWLGNHIYEFLLRIVSFDLANDEFKDLQLPDVLFDNESKRLGVFEECLCIYHFNEDIRYIDMFMMKEYGVKESWTKLFSINVDIQLEFVHMLNFKVICITNNGKLLVQWNHKDLALYDPKHGGQKCGNIKIDGLTKRLSEYRSISTYVKSLVSLGANTSLI
ncbi:hypothetical protein AQUCO_01600268v1 [Aquilegia coerulea]|uniref:F-box associated beta-propeller type 1 domain-containing protein n=1 Tax=Aquilegia coerulea TaxID=218851 RepID=A0A2G5DQX1_AQUCA|nr:hypothetical protein AQUCO_01600268v1 [Aquilegia coerulea]